jgi:putative membrane protein
MKATGLIAIACAAALTVACSGDGRDDTTTTAGNDIEQNERLEDPGVADDARVGTTGEAGRDATGQGSHGVDGDARHFAEQAAKHGAAEVELGKLAAERAQNPEVKQFAQRMVRDHTRSGEELKKAVSTHDVQLVGELPDESEELLEKLRSLKGAEFDREYMSAMVEGHEEMRGMVSGRVDDNRRESTKSPLETAVNQWAAKTLPAVEQHLQLAQQIDSKLEGNRNSTK